MDYELSENHSSIKEWSCPGARGQCIHSGDHKVKEAGYDPRTAPILLHLGHATTTIPVCRFNSVISMLMGSSASCRSQIQCKSNKNIERGRICPQDPKGAPIVQPKRTTKSPGVGALKAEPGRLCVFARVLFVRVSKEGRGTGRLLRVWRYTVIQEKLVLEGPSAMFPPPTVSLQDARQGLHPSLASKPHRAPETQDALSESSGKE